MTAKTAFIFPGQGAQYIGMGKDFYQSFLPARLIFEEANDLLRTNLTKLIFDGNESELTETKNSQIAIFVTSFAILNVIQHLFPFVTPQMSAGLSLGEYTALVASKKISFQEGLTLVQARGTFMNEACLQTKGTMAVILGLNADQVTTLVKTLNLPNDIWVANYNCPGQIVISGTEKGIEKGTEAAKTIGAKRVLPLQVYGAFHSGLMKDAEFKLTPYIKEITLNKSDIELIMNVPGRSVTDPDEIKECLIKQVTNSVRWEQGIRFMDSQAVEKYIEIGPGKTLAGFNKRIQISGQTISVEKIDDLKDLELFIGA